MTERTGVLPGRHGCAGTIGRPRPAIPDAGVVLLLAACGAGPPSPASTVRDSAGITIIESVRPAWTAGETWTISADPVFDVGGDTSGSPSSLHLVRGVHRFSDGTVVVANGEDSTLRFFDDAGHHQTVAAGYGVGKDRLVRIAWTRLFQDTLIVGQGPTAPLRRYTSNGTMVASELPDSITTVSFVTDVWPYADGTFGLLVPAQGLIPRSAAWYENAVFLRATAHDTPERVLTLRGAHFASVPPFGVRTIVFSPVLRFTWTPDRLFAGYPASFEIGVFSPDGTRLRSIRRAWDARPVTETERERVRRFVHAQIPTDGPLLEREIEEMQSGADSLPFAGTHMAYDRLLVDAEGSLWVGPPDPERLPDLSGELPIPNDAQDWDVFDADGEWLGRVTMPAHFYPTGIGTAHIAGVWRGPDGIEHARVHTITKPSATS